MLTKCMARHRTNPNPTVTLTLTLTTCVAHQRTNRFQCCCGQVVQMSCREGLESSIEQICPSDVKVVISVYGIICFLYTGMYCRIELICPSDVNGHQCVWYNMFSLRRHVLPNRTDLPERCQGGHQCVWYNMFSLRRYVLPNRTDLPERCNGNRHKHGKGVGDKYC